MDSTRTQGHIQVRSSSHQCSNTHFQGLVFLQLLFYFPSITPSSEEELLQQSLGSVTARYSPSQAMSLEQRAVCMQQAGEGKGSLVQRAQGALYPSSPTHLSATKHKHPASPNPAKPSGAYSSAQSHRTLQV